MTKYERFILDKRELSRIVRQIKYWENFTTLPKEQLQSSLDNYGLQDPNKRDRKQYRKEFVKSYIAHSQENAQKKHESLSMEKQWVAKELRARKRTFNFIDRLGIYWMEINPKSTVNSPSWNAMQMGNNCFDAFLRGYKETTGLESLYSHLAEIKPNIGKAERPKLEAKKNNIDHNWKHKQKKRPWS